MPLTPEQCRAARGLLDWTQDELAEHAGVSRGTVRGFEAGHHALRPDTGAAIQDAIEAAGVVFLPADAWVGAGVRLASPHGAGPGKSRTNGGRKREAASRVAGAATSWASVIHDARRAPVVWRCAAAAALAAAAFALRVAVGGWEAGHAYVAFLPVIVLGTVLLGPLPGLAASAIGWLLGLYFFIEPAGTWAVAEPGDVVMAILFPLACAFAVVAFEALRATARSDDRG